MYYNSTIEKNPDINCVYKEIYGLKLPLSIYLPDNFDPKKKYRTIILLHGGAWYAVTPDSPPWEGGIMRHNAIYYAKKGFIGITFSYRGINVNSNCSVNTLIEDCNDALGFIKSNFDFIDTSHTVLMGDSAGGHLALALCMNLTLQSSYITPEIVIACNPVTDCNCERWKYCADSEKIRKSASPIENIKKINSKILLIHGREDTVVSIDDSRRFFKQMSSVNNDIKITEIPNAKHAFILFGYRDSDETVSKAHEIIDEYLKRCGFCNLTEFETGEACS